MIITIQAGCVEQPSNGLFQHVSDHQMHTRFRPADESRVGDEVDKGQYDLFASVEVNLHRL
jgi:hypothetical protein